MIRKAKFKTQLKILLIILIFLVSGVYFLNFSANLSNSKNSIEDNRVDKENNYDYIEDPRLSETKSDSWWNNSFLYRRLINITNPTGEDLDNFITSIQFNYTELVIIDSKMNSSLKDIRIVENGVLRNYYIEYPFPESEIVTVWFETSVSKDATSENPEQDTFLYYGNNSVEKAYSYYMESNPEGLIWYKFEENEGDILVDSMNNYNASRASGDNNKPGWTIDAEVGTYALEFDGNDWVYIKDLKFTEINEIDELTVCGWFKTSATDTIYYDNWAFFDFDRSEYFNFFINAIDGSLGFSTSAYGGGSGSDFYSSKSGLNDGSWHFGAAKFNLSAKAIFVDEEQNAVQSNPHGIGRALGTGTDRYGFIGDGSEASSENGDRNDFYYDGIIDEIRFFEQSLSNQRIYWIYKKYELIADLNEEQAQFSILTIITKDVDGRIVPNAEVTINNTNLPYFKTQNTANNGTTTFTELPIETYNLTVNYTLQTSGKEEVVFNRKEYQLTDLYYNITLELDIWTIDFELKDWDGYPLNYGYINVSESKGNPILEKLTLSNEGTATFRWHVRASYYYEVYYYNQDYTPSTTLLNENNILRSAYTQKNNKYFDHKILVNETNEASGSNFLVSQRIYTNGSNSLGNKKLISTNITLSRMTDHLSEVRIYYIDKDNQTTSGIENDHLIYNEEYTIQQSDIIRFNISNTPTYCAKLEEDNYEAYGFLIEVEGVNFSKCNGIIQINTSETCNIFNRTELAQIHIKIVNLIDGIPANVSGVIVHVYNNKTGSNIVDLETDDTGYAYGQQSSDIGFWYLRNNVYNFTLEFYGEDMQRFNVNYTDPEDSMPINVDTYNYTLVENATIIFELLLGDELENYKTRFFNIQTCNNTMIWSENITFSLIFEYTTDYTNPTPTWSPVSNPDEINCIVKCFGQETPLFVFPMIQGTGEGNFTYTFNSSILSAGSHSVYYTIELSGSKRGYGDPINSPFTFELTLNALSTVLKVVDSTTLTELSSYIVEQYWKETKNVTVFLSDKVTTRPISDANIIYSWNYESNQPLTELPSNPGYYTFNLDTAKSPSTGVYVISISVNKENYSSYYEMSSILQIDIKERRTTIEDVTEIYYMSESIYIGDAETWSFDYRDYLTEIRIADADQAIYSLQQLDEDGDPVEDEGAEGNLNETSGHKYVLDINTEDLEVADYYIFLAFTEENYETRIVTMDLKVKLKPIEYDLKATNLKDDQVTVVKGENIVIKIEITDPTQDDEPLEDAEVILIIGDREYELEEKGDGIYTYTFKTDEIDAFFMSQTITGKITIEKDDYEDEEIDITFVITMEEIYPEVPTFYFILIVTAFVGTSGSLATYKYIQVARIPKFVKKLRKMKKAIKSNRKISKSIIYPSKEEYMVKYRGHKWKEIGLSFGEIIGIESKKGKLLPDMKNNILKSRGDDR